MMQDIKANPLHYAVLALWLSFGGILLTLSRYNPPLQSQTLILVALGYVGWGVSHHLIKKNLTGKIVLEYLLIAGLSSLLLIGVMARR